VLLEKEISEMNKGRPRKYKTPEEMQAAIDIYFDSCKPEPIIDKDGNIMMDKNGRPVFELNPPTITGLALHLGFLDRKSVYNYAGYGEKFFHTIKKARLRCENYVERNGMSGNIPANIAIFYLKNYDWTDKQEVDMKADITTKGEFSIIGVETDSNSGEDSSCC